MMMQRQHVSDLYEFSKDGREVLIKRPDTPMPWLNHLSNDDFQTWITQKGYAEAYAVNRSLNGLTNPQEKSGLIYLRDQQTGRHVMLNEPTVCGDFTLWQIRHGLGWSRLTADALGLRVDVTWFIPRSGTLLIWLVCLANQGDETREIDLFSAVEWSLGDQNKIKVLRGHGGGGGPFVGGSQFNLYKKVVFDENTLYATADCWKNLGITQETWPYTGFLTSSEQVESFDTIQDEFLGNGDLWRPQAVDAGKCTNTPVWGENEFPWGVIQNQITIDPHADQTVVVLLGMAPDRTAIDEVVGRYNTTEAARQALVEVQTFWNGFMDATINVTTPEPEMDRIINVWSKYQWRTAMLRNPYTRNRGLSFWSYGIGGSWGGSSVEVMTQAHDLAIARESLVNDYCEKYNDLSKRSESVGRPFPHNHEIFYIYIIAHYVKESGDVGFLDTSLPYTDGGEGTVFEHLCKEIDYALTSLSERNLCRLVRGVGDWNDELNMVSRHGNAESVMYSQQLAYSLFESSELARFTGREDRAAEWMGHYERIKAAVNEYAWDGEWYVRAFSDAEDELLPVGCSADQEGSIYLDSQSWAVISGIADKERSAKCLGSVEHHLMSEFGPLHNFPSYKTFNPSVGTLTKYAPGWRQSCIYLRPTGWAIMASCLGGRSDLAFEMFRSANLANLSKNTDLFQCEPYAYPEVYVGPDHRMAGRGQFQWNLGEGANWMWRAFVYYILGVRPSLDGLMIDPRIPADWDGFTVSRPFRGTLFDITVENPNHVDMGVSSVVVNGARVDGNVIPLSGSGQPDERVQNVHVVLER